MKDVSITELVDRVIEAARRLGSSDGIQFCHGGEIYPKGEHPVDKLRVARKILLDRIV